MMKQQKQKNGSPTVRKLIILTILLIVDFYYYVKDNDGGYGVNGFTTITMTTTTTTKITPTTSITNMMWSSSLSSNNNILNKDLLLKNYNLIRQSLLSPSKKLTLSPEIIIYEPKDPTSLLLQNNAVQSLSTRIRTSQANTIFLHSTSLSSLQTFSTEQQTSLGNIPGPVPIIYCLQEQHQQQNDENSSRSWNSILLQNVVEAGAQGILVPIQMNYENNDFTFMDDNNTWEQICYNAYQVGLQPIPEIIIFGTTSNNNEVISTQISEECLEKLIRTISDRMVLGRDDELSLAPVAIVVSVDSKNEEVDSDDVDDGDNHNTEEKEGGSVTLPEALLLPKIPISISKKIPVLGSIHTVAGDNRLSIETTELKQLGYTGTLLRKECVPGYTSIKFQLDVISQFWQACIMDLKSTKSKSFGFRAKNNMDMSTSDKWMRYRKNVLESGALGDPNESASAMSGLNEAAGDYKGFA